MNDETGEAAVRRTFGVVAGSLDTESQRLRCVVTGANRGLGLEFVRQLIAAGERIVGLCRKPDTAAELRALLGSDRAAIVAVEMSDQRSVRRAAAAVAARLDAVDLLINAAGVDDTAGSSGPIGTLDAEALLEVYEVNAVGPALVVQAFRELLAGSPCATVLNLTSNRDSLSGTVVAGHIGYAMSKSALDMLTRKLALELRPDRTTVVAVSPGWVRTDMGGPDAPLTAAESVRAMLALARRVSLGDSGAVLDHDAVRAGAGWEHR